MMIRYFLPVVVGPLGDVGYEYLRLLEDTGIRVRALPIGPATAIGGAEPRWYEAGHLFTTPMAIPFVNIVCAPAGLMLGTKTPMLALGGTADLVKQEDGVTDVSVFPPELRKLLGEMGVKSGAAAPQIIYEPQTAFGGLHTARCTNIAIVAGVDRISDREREQLARYDLVICPSVFSMLSIARSCNAIYFPATARAGSTPERQSAELVKILEDTCRFATTATTARSPDTEGPPATTWLRSKPPTTSSSRSLSSETFSSPPSPATAISTNSRFRTAWSRVIRRLRSFMRSLAFWRK